MALFRRKDDRETITKRLIEIEVRIRSIERQIASNNNTEARITQILESLGSHEKQLEEKEAQLKDHIQGEARLGAQGFQQANRDAANLRAIVRRLRIQLEVNMRDLKEVGELAQQNAKLQNEISNLVREAEQLLIRLINMSENLPRLDTIMRYSDYGKLRGRGG